MKLKTYLGITSLLGIFGFMMIVAPAFMARGFGLPLNELSRVLFRDLGSAVVGIAIINWFARGIEDKKALTVIVIGDFVIQLLGVVVIVVDTVQGYLGASGWGVAFVHTVLTLGFVYYYFQLKKSTDRSPL